MILPNVRVSFKSAEIDLLLRVLEQRTRRDRWRWEGQLAEEGLDALLDRPELLPAVLEGRGVSTLSPKLAFYVMVRHTLLDCGLGDPSIADYITALLLEFADSRRAYKITRHDDRSYYYLIDLVAELDEESSERRRFLLRAHLGNYSLWLSGLFPDYVVARVHRKGSPGFDYYEEMGATGFMMASASELAGHYDVADLYRQVAGGFRAVRRALNRLSDRYFFPVSPSPVDRLLRQTIDRSDSN